MPNVFHKDYTLDNNHALHARQYADITARDADTAFNSDATNVGKAVLVDSPPSVFTLLTTGPLFLEFSNTTAGDVTTSDTLVAGQLLLGNGTKDIVTEADLSYDGSTLSIDGSVNISANNILSFNGVTILEDTGGVQLANIGLIDPTTKTAIETAITTLPSLGFVGSVSGEVLGPSGAWQEGGFNAGPDDAFKIDSVTLLDGTASVHTLMNINALDATTEATIEAAIDTLANLTSVQGLAVAYADAAENAIWGWDDTGSTYRNLSQAEVQAIVGGGSGNVTTSDTLLATQLLLGNGAQDIFSESSLTFDNSVATAVINGNEIPIQAEDDSAMALAFNDDGSQFYFVGAENDSIYEYALSTNFDLSSETFTQSFVFATEDNNPRGIAFNDTGSKLYMVGRQNDSVFQYALSPNYDISTAVVIGGGLSLSSEDTAPSGIVFNTDGSKMYMVGNSSNSVHEYDCSTNFDSSTAVILQSFDIGPEDTNPRDIYFTANGLEMLIAGVVTSRILSYKLTIAFDISTAFLTATLDASAFDTGISGVALSNDKTKLFISGAVTDTIYELDLNPAFGIGVPTDITVGTDEDNALSLTSITNGGDVQFLTGDRNPNGVIDSSSPNVYYSSRGDLSGTYENRGVGSTDTWLKRSVLPGNIFELHNSAELDDQASGGVITIAVDTSWHVRGALTTANRIVVNAGINFSISGEFNSTASITYSGTGTFFTNSGNLQLHTNVVFISTSTGTLISGLPSSDSNFDFVIFDGWDDLGSVTGAGTFFCTKTVFLNFGIGFVFTNIRLINVTRIAQAGSLFTGVWFTVNTDNPSSFFDFTQTTAGNFGATGSVFDFNTRINNAVVGKISTVNVTGGALFKPSTLTDATINSVADGSIATGTLTAMADNGSGGTTVSSTTTYFEDEEVALSGTTNYNGDFQIFNVVAGVSFDIIAAFVADDATGSADSVRLTLTLAGGHGISTGDSVKIIDTNFYNAFETILNVATNDVTVNGVFVSTDTGAIERELSLDQSDPRIFAALNDNFPASAFIATGFVNDNSTVNPAIVNNTFTDMLFGTVGDAIVAGSTMERWKLVSELLGIFEYTGLAPFDGSISFDFTVVSSGGTTDFRFKWQIDTGSGFVDLPDNVEALAAVGSDAQSVTKTYPLKVNKGDQIKPQITRNSGASTITTTYATVYAGMG